MKTSEIPKNDGAAVREIALLDRLTRSFPRSSDQVNEPHESDAELVRLPGGGLLAITTDAMSEEIETGLYEDPHLIGWMTVIASASDLAAVGADPLGVLIHESLPPHASPEFVASLQAGIADACAASGLAVLGGDTNRSRQLHVGATAVGVLPEGEVLTRRGSRPGDAVFASAPLGKGGAYAFARLADPRGPDRTDAGRPVRFRPRARLAEGRLLRRFGSACMDSSDGALPTLDELMRINGVGIDLDADATAILDAESYALARAAGLPGWMLLAGPHGEFELIFTVPEDRLPDFLEAAGGIGWRPVRLGEVVETRGLRLPIEGRLRRLDTTAIRNLFDEVAGNLASYLAALRTIHRRLTATRPPDRAAHGGERGRTS